MNQKDFMKPIKSELKQAKLVLRPFDPLIATGNVSGKIKITIISDVAVNGTELHYVKTPKGYLAFYNLNNKNYTFSVETDYYLNRTFDISFPVINFDSKGKILLDEEITLIQKNNIIIADLRLLPAPVYLFSGGSTLMRIVVCKKNKSKDPVAGAKISVKFKNKNSTKIIYVSRTDLNGQAVICCNRMTKSEILQMNGFTINGPKTISIVAEDPITGKSGSEEIEVKEFWESSVTLTIPL